MLIFSKVVKEQHVFSYNWRFMNGIISPHAINRHSLMSLIPNHTQNYAVTYTINIVTGVFTRSSILWTCIKACIYLLTWPILTKKMLLSTPWPESTIVLMHVQYTSIFQNNTECVSCMMVATANSLIWSGLTQVWWGRV